MLLRACSPLADHQLGDGAAPGGLAVDEPRGRHLEQLEVAAIQLAYEAGGRIREQYVDTALLEPQRYVPQPHLAVGVEAIGRVLGKGRGHGERHIRWIEVHQVT